MTNDLKNFLEKYHDNEIFSDDQLGEIQYVIIPKVLELVQSEVGKLYEPYEGEEQIMIEHHMLDKVSTIIDNLRV